MKKCRIRFLMENKKMKQEKELSIIKLHQSTINELYKIAIEINKQLTVTIIEEIQRINKENTIQLMDELQKRKRENEKLYNLKELSKIIGIKYRTLLEYDLPSQTIGRQSRKMYNLNEVKEYLKR